MYERLLHALKEEMMPTHVHAICTQFNKLML